MISRPLCPVPLLRDGALFFYPCTCILTRMTLAERTIELINIPSVTGDEAAVLTYLENVLVEMGLSTEKEMVEEHRWNLYAGWDHPDPVVFCTHVDTVPPHYPATVDGHTITGRGACDTKGIIAAMLEAGRQLLAAGEHPAFLFVVGEETDSIGAKKAAASGKTAAAIIVGEPTDNHLASGHKGVLSYTLRTSGKAAHSAYPDRGSSAVHVLLDVLAEIRQAEWGTHEVLGEATINVGLIDGGLALNTFAPAAKATVMHRLVDDAEKRRQQLVELLDGRADVQFHSVSQPQLLVTAEGFDTKAVNFGTDIPYLYSMAPCLLLGPGSVHDAHTDHECIETGQLDKAVQLYIRLYQTLIHTP
mgnify:CR=1 FL=1